MANVEPNPQKRPLKVSEICRLTDTQPYVLRFWESEFPQLSPERGRGGQAVYCREDVDLILRIKQLLYEEEYTIDAARLQLDEERNGAGRATAGAELQASSAHEVPPGGAEEASDSDVVARPRYEDALEEIAVLRLRVQEAEARRRKAEIQAQRAEEIADRQRQRSLGALARLEKLLESLG